MLHFIIDLLTSSVIPVETTIAIGPLALAGIGAGVSALGGLLSNRANRSVSIETPDQLTGLINDLEDPNFFLGALQRAVNNDQGFFNINASLASRGIDSSRIAQEQREALEADRQDAITSGLDRLEGLRLNALQNALGQLTGIRSQNARLRQQQVNNNLDIISSATSGIGGSFIQGLGAKIQQDNFNKFLDQMGPFGQTGGTGFSINDQFGTGGLDIPSFDDGFLGGLGGSNNFT